MFWANLYHPEELDQIHAIFDLFLPRQRMALPQASSYATPDQSFFGFFQKGCVGHTLFPLIRPYLDVYDLACFVDSGISRGDKCGLFTVSDILHDRGVNLNRADRIRVGTETAKNVSSYKGRNPHAGSRPHRAVDGLGDRWRCDRLYHPEERLLVQRYVDWCLQVLANRRTIQTSIEPRMSILPGDLFLSASFGSFDVTLKIAALVRENAGVLRLAPPLPIRNARGGRAYIRIPLTFHYWYLRYFGDPQPHERKYLVLTMLRPQTGQLFESCFEENSTVTLLLGTQLRSEERL